MNYATRRKYEISILLTYLFGSLDSVSLDLLRFRGDFTELSTTTRLKVVNLRVIESICHVSCHESLSIPFRFYTNEMT